MVNETGFPINNFTRVATFGDGRGFVNYGVNWVKVEVDPTSRYVWKFIPMIVKANSPDQTARRRLALRRSLLSTDYPRSMLNDQSAPPQNVAV